MSKYIPQSAQRREQYKQMLRRARRQVVTVPKINSSALAPDTIVSAEPALKLPETP